MKKIPFIIALVVSLSVLFASCIPVKTESAMTKMTAEQIVYTYLNAGFPIKNVIVYTAQNDATKMLGSPNSYTSKVTFADSRSKETSSSTLVNGTVEVFNNTADAKAFYDKVTASSGQLNAFSKYNYIFENVLLRLEDDLTPAQAKQYEDAFKLLAKNKALPRIL